MSRGELRLTDRDGTPRHSASISRYIVRDQEITFAFSGDLFGTRGCLGSCDLERDGPHLTGAAVLRPAKGVSVLCAISAEVAVAADGVRIRGSWISVGDEFAWGVEVDLYP